MLGRFVVETASCGCLLKRLSLSMAELLSCACLVVFPDQLKAVAVTCRGCALDILLSVIVTFSGKFESGDPSSCAEDVRHCVSFKGDDTSPDWLELPVSS